MLLFSMRFLLLFVLFSELFGSSTVVPASRFNDIDQQIRHKGLDPAFTIIFIDLDDTLLRGGRGKIPASLLDPEALRIMGNWKRAGFRIAFLTSRSEKERDQTVDDLKAIGLKGTVDLFITNGQKKGVWLKENTEAIPETIQDVVLIDDNRHQLDSLPVDLGERLQYHLFNFGLGSAIESTPASTKGYEERQTESGGTNSTFFLRKPNTPDPEYILKKSDGREKAFMEEVLADAIYAAIGKAEPSFHIHVPAFRVVRNKEGAFQRISQFIPGTPLGTNIDETQKAAVAAGFIVDAFMANWDLVVDGKNLWRSSVDGTIYRMDNGGSLRVRAVGAPKQGLNGYDFNTVVCDLETLRGKQCLNNPGLPQSKDGNIFYGHLSTKEILTQVEKLVALQDVILRTVDTYNVHLNIDNVHQLKSSLIMRLESLKTYYYDQVLPVRHYTQAHPYAVVIPGKSSASVLMYARQNGRNKILLAKRIRHEWWGNFGGKADDDDGTLVHAAAREVSEESMGLYDLQDGELVNKPSHDLIKDSQGPDALHRMYITQVPYIASSEFKTSLGTQTEEHSQEYTDFAWVDAQALLKLVEDNINTVNDQANENQYVLQSEGSWVAIHHPLMDMLRQAPVVAWLKQLVEAPQENIVPTHTVGSPGIVGALGDGVVPPPFWDPRAEHREQLVHITGKHFDVVSELKRKARVYYNEDQHLSPSDMKGPVTLPAVSGYSLPAQSATEAYLRLSLGEQFVSGNDQANIYNFLQGHGANLAKDYQDIFRDDGLSPEEEANYKTILLQSMQTERAMKDWFVFYHTLPTKMAFIYDIATEFRNLMRFHSTADGEVHSLRALDIYFKGLENVEAFLHDEMKRQNITDLKSIDNYQGNFQERGLPTNVFLFGSPSHPTSATFHMLRGNVTVRPPNYERFLNNLLSQFGLLDTNKYFDLYKKYFEESQDNDLLQIFISPTVVNDMVYLSWTVGRGLASTYAQQVAKYSPSVFLGHLREGGAAPEEIALDELQARVFMMPKYMTDNTKVQIKRYFKKAPKPGYYQALRAMVRQDVLQFLSNHIQLVPDTLENPSEDGIIQALPPIQKLYRHTQQAAGKVYDSQSPESLYGTFLLTDNVQGIQQILAQNPEFDLFKTIPSPGYYGSGADEISLLKVLKDKPKILEFILREKSAILTKTLEDYKSAPDTQEKSLIIDLVKAVVEKDIDIIALASDFAKAGGFSRIPTVKLAAINLCVALVNKNQSLPQAMEIAIDGLKDHDYDIRKSAHSLLDVLFEKDQGLEEALNRASVDITNMDSDIRRIAITIFKALFEKNKGIFEAIKIAQEEVLSFNRSSRNGALELFDALFEKGQGFDKAFEIAKKGIGSNDTVVREVAQLLFRKLLMMGHYIPEAIELASTSAVNEDRNIAMSGRELFKILFAQGYGFDEAIVTATQGIISTSQNIRHVASLIFSDLFEQNKEAEAPIAAIIKEGMKATHADIRATSIDLCNTLFIKGGFLTSSIPIDIAVRGVQDSDFYVVEAGKRLFVDLFEKGQGFEEAIRAATECIGKTGNPYADRSMDGSIALFKELFKRNQGFDAALSVAINSLLSSDTGVIARSLKLLAALVEVDKNIDAARVQVIQFIDNNDMHIRAASLELLTALVKKGELIDDSIIIARQSFEREAQSPAMNDALYYARDLFGALFDKGVGFEEGVAVASAVGRNSSHYIAKTASDLFLKLLAKKKGISEAKEYYGRMEASIESYKKRDWREALAAAESSST